MAVEHESDLNNTIIHIMRNLSCRCKFDRVSLNTTENVFKLLREKPSGGDNPEVKLLQIVAAYN